MKEKLKKLKELFQKNKKQTIAIGSAALLVVGMCGMRVIVASSDNSGKQTVKAEAVQDGEVPVKDRSKKSKKTASVKIQSDQKKEGSKTVRANSNDKKKPETDKSKTQVKTEEKKTEENKKAVNTDNKTSKDENKAATAKKDNSKEKSQENTQVASAAKNESVTKSEPSNSNTGYTDGNTKETTTEPEQPVKPEQNSQQGSTPAPTPAPTPTPTPTPAPTPEPPAHVHDFSIPIYGQEPEMVMREHTFCSTCRKDITGSAGQHMDESWDCGGYYTEWRQDETGNMKQIIIGHQCSCGAVQ